MATSETWAKRVAAWRASGKPTDEYATGRGFAGSTLRWWASRLGRRQAAFVRVVSAREPGTRDGGVELEVGGVRVLVRAGFDRATLAEVLELLRAGGSS